MRKRGAILLDRAENLEALREFGRARRGALVDLFGQRGKVLAARRLPGVQRLLPAVNWASGADGCTARISNCRPDSQRSKNK